MKLEWRAFGHNYRLGSAETLLKEDKTPSTRMFPDCPEAPHESITIYTISTFLGGIPVSLALWLHCTLVFVSYVFRNVSLERLYKRIRWCSSTGSLARNWGLFRKGESNRQENTLDVLCRTLSLCPCGVLRCSHEARVRLAWPADIFSWYLHGRGQLINKQTRTHARLQLCLRLAYTCIAWTCRRNTCGREKKNTTLLPDSKTH